MVDLGEWKPSFEGMGVSRKKGGHIEKGLERKMILDWRGRKAQGLEMQMIAGSAEGKNIHSH